MEVTVVKVKQALLASTHSLDLVPSFSVAQAVVAVAVPMSGPLEPLIPEQVAVYLGEE